MYSNDDASTKEIAEALKKLSKALKAEEIFWKKKNRVLWLREGIGTQKFSDKAKTGEKSNWDWYQEITRLIDASGNITKD